MSTLLDKIYEYEDEAAENVGEGLYYLERNDFEKAAQRFMLAKLFSDMRDGLSSTLSEDNERYHKIVFSVDASVCNMEIAAMRALELVPSEFLSMSSRVVSEKNNEKEIGSSSACYKCGCETVVKTTFTKRGIEKSIFCLSCGCEYKPIVE